MSKYVIGFFIMNRTKSSSVAGMFYPINKDELLDVLKSFDMKNKKDYAIESRAIIVPHAGYFYSGQLASMGFQYLSKKVKNIFIIAPSHHVALENPVLSSFDAWQTPLGEISINQEINKELISNFGCSYLDDAFEKEHAVEVQVPFIQLGYSEEIKIVPILANFYSIKELAQIIKNYYLDEANAFVISSDLSHYLNEKEAQKIDSVTADMIETMGVGNMNPQQACGSAGICALHDFSQMMNFSLIRVGMTTSGEVTKDKERVVGYGAWVLYEGEKAEFIKRYFSDFVLDFCKQCIIAGLEKKQITLKPQIPEVFKELGAVFVTLQKNGRLRGCIGSIVAHQPMIIDLAQHSYDAAFNDRRFTPLQKEELSEISVSVSILSSPVKMNFDGEKDLLSKIEEFKDGIIIKDKNYQAVYLPSVWEQIPNKEDFLRSLKVKAGLSPDYFSDTFEAFKFSTVYIQDK